MARKETTRTEVDLLESLGMKIVEGKEGKEAKPSSNLLALPTSIATSQRLFANMLDIACMVDHDEDRNRARSRMRSRVVVKDDGENPVVVPVMFEAKLVYDKSGKPIDLKISATIQLDNIGSVSAVPLISHGIPYLVRNAEGKTESNGIFQCMVFFPKKRDGDFKLLPLGLAEPSNLSMYNRIARESGKGAEIKPIENSLRRAGVRVMTFMPKYQTTHNYGEREETCIGYLYGQKLVLAIDSQDIPHDVDEDGDRCFMTKHVFRVMIRESSLELTWLKRDDGTPIDMRVPVMEVSAEMDAFAVLGLTPLTADERKFEMFARRLADGSHDRTNPLYRSAIEMGLILEGDADHLVKPILIELAKKAVQKIGEEMEVMWHILKKQIMIAGPKPSIEVLLQGRRLEHALKTLTKPEDAAGEWIKSKLGSFDPSCQLHLKARRFLLNSQASAVNYKDEDPAKDAKPEQPPVSADVEEKKDVPDAKAEGTNGVGNPESGTAEKAPAKKRAPRGVKKASDDASAAS